MSPQKHFVTGANQALPNAGKNEAAAPILLLSDVSLGYSGCQDCVLQGVTLAVHEREIVALLGESGCGKTSLLNIAGGLLKADAGIATFHGAAITTTPPEISIVFQDACLLPWLTVAENVRFGLGFKSMRIPLAEQENRISDALLEVGLEDASVKYPAQLSGGMAQRVALARTLARRAQLILLDEPFSALDAITRGAMQRLLLQIIHNHNSSALIVTHDMDEALILADRLLLMIKKGGSTQIIEWNLIDIFGGFLAAEDIRAERDRRSALFLDLREEISQHLVREGM